MEDTVIDSQAAGHIERYLKDVIHSYNLLSTRYTPLYTDPVTSDSTSGEAVLHSDIRRGMGIVEAEKVLRRFVLLGEPGAGKSTALQYLTLHNARRLLEKPAIIRTVHTDPSLPRIPIFMEMNLYRYVEGSNGIRKMIIEQFYPYVHTGDFDKKIDSMLTDGSLLVILDGLNECPLRLWEHAVHDIRHFHTTFPHTHTIVSCRSRDFPDLFQLSVLSLRKLSTASVDRFVEKSLQGVKNFKSKCDQFKKYFYREYPQIISNPLILSISLKVYRDSGWELPANYGKLFRKFFVLWFKNESLKLRKSAATARTMITLELAGTIGFYLQNRGEVRTSIMAVWGVITSFLERNIHRSVVKREVYTADALLDELLGMGLLIETEGRVKFYHQLFQEFFAGYHLLQSPIDDAVMRLEYSWWNEPLEFYEGLVDDPTPLIHEALQKNTVFDAARLLKASDGCSREVRLIVYKDLIAMCSDKFQLNREKARSFLSRIQDEQLDVLIEQVIDSSESDQLKDVCRSIQKDRSERSRQKDDLNYKLSKNLETGKISELHFSYSGSMRDFFKKLQKSISEENIDLSAVKTREIAAKIGIELFEKELYRLVQAGDDVNWILFLTWCIATVKETHSIHSLLEIHSTEKLAGLFPDKSKWQPDLDLITRVMANIILDPKVERIWRLEFAQIGLYDAPDPEIVAPFAKALGSLLKIPDLHDEHARYLIQILWDLEPEYAEEFFIKLLENGLPAKYESIVLKFLKGYGLSEVHFESGLDLFDKAKDEHRVHFPELLAKTNSRNSLSFLMNLIKDESQPLALRSEAISAMQWKARKDEVPFLQELNASNVPELYDPAYRVLDKLKRRLRDEEKIFAAENAEDIALDYLLDEDELIKSPLRPRIIINEDAQRSVIINNVRIKFGSVSGRIFFFLAKNSSLGSYYSIEDIRSYLERQDLYLDASSVRNRISDIRKNIVRSLEGRIDPHYLIENARRFGYRINADVEVR